MQLYYSYLFVEERVERKKILTMYEEKYRAFNN